MNRRGFLAGALGFLAVKAVTPAAAPRLWNLHEQYLYGRVFHHNAFKFYMDPLFFTRYAAPGIQRLADDIDQDVMRALEREYWIGSLAGEALSVRASSFHPTRCWRWRS